MWIMTEFVYQSEFRPVETLEQLGALAVKQWGKRVQIDWHPAGKIVRVYQSIADRDKGHEIACAVWRAELELPPIDESMMPAELAESIPGPAHGGPEFCPYEGH